MDSTGRVDPEDAFAACWRTDMPRVLRYAQRHVGSDAALDVASEVFVVAWRRWDEVPSPALPWLLGVARKVVSTHRRSLRRRHDLGTRLRRLHNVTRESADAVDAVERLDALRRLAALGDDERETVLLVAWDGLSSAEAARVLGISAPTFRKRLSRARASLDGSANASTRTRLSLEMP